MEITSELRRQTELRTRYAACLTRLRQLVISLHSCQQDVEIYCTHRDYPDYNKITGAHIDNLRMHVERSILQLADANFCPEISEIAEEEHLITLYEAKYRTMIDLATINSFELYGEKGEDIATAREFWNQYLKSTRMLMRALDTVSNNPHLVPASEEMANKLKNDMAFARQIIQPLIDRAVLELDQPVPSVTGKALAALLYEIKPTALFLFRDVIDRLKVGNLPQMATAALPEPVTMQEEIGQTGHQQKAPTMAITLH